MIAVMVSFGDFVEKMDLMVNQLNGGEKLWHFNYDG